MHRHAADLRAATVMLHVFVLVSGADVVDWLYSRVEGFKDRRDARKYASSLLKHGYLRHTVNKITFSEQCYYTFGDLCQSTSMSLRVCDPVCVWRVILNALPLWFCFFLQ